MSHYTTKLRADLKVAILLDSCQTTAVIPELPYTCTLSSAKHACSQRGGGIKLMPGSSSFLKNKGSGMLKICMSDTSFPEIWRCSTSPDDQYNIVQLQTEACIINLKVLHWLPYGASVKHCILI